MMETYSTIKGGGVWGRGNLKRDEVGWKALKGRIKCLRKQEECHGVEGGGRRKGKITRRKRQGRMSRRRRKRED